MKKDNRYIRKEANGLLTSQLRRLFLNKNMRLGENPSTADEDMGIDYFFEVLDDTISQEPKHLFLFYNQNKGTDKEIKKIKTKSHEHFGKIPFTISLRHAEYFYNELEEGLLFTLCDINNKNIYWYDIQNDPMLPERMLEQKAEGHSFIQIYIPADNLLGENTFERLFKQIDYAKYNQIRKKRIVKKDITADYSKTKITDSNILNEILHTLKLFEGIKVLPTNVISQLYPFKGSDKTFFNDWGFYTDNEKFFDFMDSIVINRNKLESSENLEYESDKLREVINFFQYNKISHIRWSGSNSKNQICIHKLYDSSKCDCERCNLENLNFVRAKELLRDHKSDSKQDLMRKGYTYYLMGDYIKSSKIFLEVYNDANKTINPINYTISKYNLIKLRGFIKSSYYGDDKNKILEKINDLEFDDDERFIKQNAPHFVDIYKNIKEIQFYDDVENKINNFFLEIQKIHYRDSNGGGQSIDSYYKLKSSFLRFNSYIEHNFIIFNSYQEYIDISKKVLESLFILYSLKNPNSEKYEIFEWYAIKVLIFNVNEEFIKYLFNRYAISNLKVYENVLFKINELLENLLFSYDELADQIDIFKPLRLEKIINNLVMILSIIDIENKEKEKFILKILIASKKLLKLNLIPYDGLYFFVEKVDVNKKTLKKILDLFILKEYKGIGFTYILDKYVKICSADEIEQLIKDIFNISEITQLAMGHEYFDDLVYSLTLINHDTKLALKKILTEKLHENFDVFLFETAVLYELIDFDMEMFDTFLSLIPDMSNFDESKVYFRSYENIHLLKAINIAFKFKVDLIQKIRPQLHKIFKGEKAYFIWLTDLDNFDYKEFNSYWILRGRTKYFIEKFKNSKKLKEEIVKSLKNNYVEGVAKMYFKELV
ncbi:hypothetical protein [Chryseobacterium sp. S90]|uniref:hypothetical protein n=1 Tax=Chryseobacterium sp. S90 TaxID=3395373 RepID=UPI0039BC3711